MGTNIINYAFTTALYCQKRNFLETFSPFILKILYDGDCQMNDTEVCEKLRNNFDLDIPTNTVKSILNGLKSEGLLKSNVKNRDVWQVCITESGKKEVERLNEDEQDVKRRQNKLTLAFGKYLKEQGIEVSTIEIEDTIVEYVKTNISRLSLFHVDDFEDEKQDDELGEGYNYHLTNFITIIYNSETELYETYEEILKGVILRSYINNNRDDIELRKLEPLAIYLDANVLLSLLDFHSTPINIAAKQLIKLLKEDPNITLKTFSITINEISRLFRQYKNHMDDYNPNIPVNSVFYYLKSKGFDELKTDNYIQNLDRIIIDLGISIEILELKEHDKFVGEDLDLYKDIYSYKNAQNTNIREETRKDEVAIHKSALHDANIIIAVKRKRGEWVKNLERSKAVFLTSSFLMDQFCKRAAKEHDRFPEVILDLNLTNIFWLKNPNKEIGIHLHQLISGHSKRFIIENGIWNKFRNSLKELSENETISHEQFATVYSNNQLTLDYLHKVEFDDISFDSVLDLAKKIENDIKRKDELLNEKERIIAENLTENEIKEKELKEKETALGELKSKNQSLQERLELTSKDIEKLKREKELDKYVDNKMDEEFYPLSKKFLWFVVWSIIGITFIFIAEVIDQSFLTFLGLKNSFFYWILKFIGFIGLFIFGLSNFSTMKEILRYRTDHSKLKREYVKKFSTEFENLKK